jgi:hypothetical protein
MTKVKRSSLRLTFLLTKFQLRCLKFKCEAELRRETSQQQPVFTGMTTFYETVNFVQLNDLTDVSHILLDQ